MRTTKYSEESESTREIREFRRENAKRYSKMTNAEILAEEEDAMKRLEAEGMTFRIRDPRTEPRA